MDRRKFLTGSVVAAILCKDVGAEPYVEIDERFHGDLFTHYVVRVNGKHHVFALHHEFKPNAWERQQFLVGMAERVRNRPTMCNVFQEVR